MTAISDFAVRLRWPISVNRKAFEQGELERYRYGMSIRVECYAGYRGEQEPLAFSLGERRLTVRAVVDRWFAPTQRWFKVDADDGNVYVLRHDEASGDWELAAYRRAAS